MSNYSDVDYYDPPDSEIINRGNENSKQSQALRDDLSKESDNESSLDQGSLHNNDNDDEDWIYEDEESSTEEPDTEWDNKRDVDATVGLDTIIDNVDQSLDKEKLKTISERYTNPTIVAMFLIYTKHLLSVKAYADLVNVIQQPWFDPIVLPRSLKGTISYLLVGTKGYRFTCNSTIPTSGQFAGQ